MIGPPHKPEIAMHPHFRHFSLLAVLLTLLILAGCSASPYDQPVVGTFHMPNGIAFQFQPDGTYVVQGIRQGSFTVEGKHLHFSDTSGHSGSGERLGEDAISLFDSDTGRGVLIYRDGSEAAQQAASIKTHPF